MALSQLHALTSPVDDHQLRALQVALKGMSPAQIARAGPAFVPHARLPGGVRTPAQWLAIDGIGTRLNRENLDEAAILAEIDILLGRYAAGRNPGERFGDYLIRDGIVRPVVNPAEDCHA
jgi:sulfite reductase beta subunit-like hemoprotein